MSTETSIKRGFTLVELAVVMAVLAILAAIGVPNYSRYVTRKNLAEAGSALANYRVQREKFDQDTRTYATGTGCGSMPPANLDGFSVSCSVAAGGQGFLATATGTGALTGVVYTIDQANTRSTAAIPTHWGRLPSDAVSRWVTR